MAAPTATTETPVTPGRVLPSPQRKAGLSGPFDKTIETITRGLDQAVPGLRGRLVHEYLMANGYFTDRQRAEALYGQNDAIDAYLDNLSLQRAAEGGGQGQGIGPATALAIGSGFAAGLLTAAILS